VVLWTLANMLNYNIVDDKNDVYIVRNKLCKCTTSILTRGQRVLTYCIHNTHIYIYIYILLWPHQHVTGLLTLHSRYTYITTPKRLDRKTAWRALAGDKAIAIYKTGRGSPCGRRRRRRVCLCFFFQPHNRSGMYYV